MGQNWENIFLDYSKIHWYKFLKKNKYDIFVRVSYLEKIMDYTWYNYELFSSSILWNYDKNCFIFSPIYESKFSSSKYFLKFLWSFSFDNDKKEFFVNITPTLFPLSEINDNTINEMKKIQTDIWEAIDYYHKDIPRSNSN